MGDGDDHGVGVDSGDAVGRALVNPGRSAGLSPGRARSTRLDAQADVDAGLREGGPRPLAVQAGRTAPGSSRYRPPGHP